MFHLVGQFFFGLVVGTFAKLFMPGPDSGSVILTAVIGFLGSMAGTLLAYACFGARNYSAGWILSTITTILFLAIYRYRTGHRKHPGILH